MKRTILVLSALAFCIAASSQDPKYLPMLKPLFSAADSTVSPSSSFRPLIGVYDHSCIAGVAAAGGGPLTEEGYMKIHGKCFGMLEKTIADVEKYPEYCGIARTPAEALKLRDEGKKV